VQGSGPRCFLDRERCQQCVPPKGTAEALKEVHNSVRGGRCRETGLWLALVSADVTGERAGRIFSAAAAVLNPAAEVVAQPPCRRQSTRSREAHQPRPLMRRYYDEDHHRIFTLDPIFGQKPCPKP
jgi:hypothetical protein